MASCYRRGRLGIQGRAPACQLHECARDVRGKCVEGGVICIRANPQDDVSQEIRRKQAESSKLAKAALEAIPGHGRLLEPWYDETDAHSRSSRTRERGSRSPNLEM